MHLQECHHRTNYDTIELSMTITDDGWTGLLEDVRAPADEVDQFDKRVRDPTGGVTHK